MAIGQPSGRLSLGGASAQITPPHAWTPTQRGRQEANRPGGAGMSAHGGLGKAEGPSPQLSQAWSSPAGLTGFGCWERSLPRDPDPRARRSLPGHFTEQPGGGQKHLWPHLRPGGGHAESGAVSRPVPRPRQAAPALRVPASLQGGVRSCGWVPGSDTADPGLHRGDGRGAWVPVQGPLAPDITRLPH